MHPSYNAFSRTLLEAPESIPITVSRRTRMLYPSPRGGREGRLRLAPQHNPLHTVTLLFRSYSGLWQWTRPALLLYAAIINAVCSLLSLALVSAPLLPSAALISVLPDCHLYLLHRLPKATGDNITVCEHWLRYLVRPFLQSNRNVLIAAAVFAIGVARFRQ